MDKLTWGMSQALTSALFFLLQLCFLKSENLQDMALFSALFALLNFILLAVRRAMIEIHQTVTKLPSLPFMSVITFTFITLGIFVAYLINFSFWLVFLVAVLLFNQLVLDFMRFSNYRNHLVFMGIQGGSLIMILCFMLAGLTPKLTLFLVVIAQGTCVVYLYVHHKEPIMNFRNSLRLVSATRLLDFAVSSGFGFLLPFLTYLILDEESVGELRTSQNFLSLANIFTSAIYYSTLKSQSDSKMHNSLYFLPSLVLIGILGTFTFFVPSRLSTEILGPYFKDSIILTLLLIICLVPALWVFRMNAILVNLKEFDGLFKIHTFSLILLACGSLFGFHYFGVISFGIFTFLASIVEILLIRRLLKLKS